MIRLSNSAVHRFKTFKSVVSIGISSSIGMSHQKRKWNEGRRKQIRSGAWIQSITDRECSFTGVRPWLVVSLLSIELGSNSWACMIQAWISGVVKTSNYHSRSVIDPLWTTDEKRFTDRSSSGNVAANFYVLPARTSVTSSVNVRPTVGRNRSTWWKRTVFDSPKSGSTNTK